MKIPYDLQTPRVNVLSLARIVSEDSNMFVPHTCGDKLSVGGEVSYYL